MINDQIINISELELAKFILSEIIKNQYCIEKMAEELDNNKRLVSKIIYSFIDIGWIIRNANGTYSITTKCKNIIERIN
jgi:predicted transcriptional regulator